MFIIHFVYNIYCVVLQVYSGPYRSVQLVPKFDLMKRSFFWLEATNIIFETKMEVDSKAEIPLTVKVRKHLSQKLIGIELTFF